MYSFRKSYLKNAFDKSQNNFAVIGLRKYTASNGTRTKTGTAYTLNSGDIVQDSFKITSAITTNQYYDSGGCVASELEFTINNTDGRFDNVNLNGYECYVYIGNRNYVAYRDEDEEEEIEIPTEYTVIDDAAEITSSTYTPCVYNNEANKGLTYYCRSSATYEPIDELLPMGVFKITEIKNNFDVASQKIKSIKVVALDRMALLDEIIDTSKIMSSISSLDKQSSCTYRSFQFAMVIDYLDQVLYGKNVANFDGHDGFYLCRMDWSDCSLVCSPNNKGTSSTVGDVHQMGINLYVYDTDSSYALGTTYNTYSTWENYVPYGRKNMTYRAMLQYLCEMMGCNAYFNRLGLLEFDWLSNTILYSVTARTWKNRRNKINLDTSKYKDFNYLTNETIWLAGASYETNAASSITYYGAVAREPQIGIYQNITSNKLIGDGSKNSNGSTDTTKVHGYLATTMNQRNRFHYETTRTYIQFKYRPFECKYLNTPYLDLCDNVSTLGNATYDSYLTDITYTTSTFMRLKARGVENEN